MSRDLTLLRERSDDRKYVCASQATIKEDSLVWLFKDANKTSVTVKGLVLLSKKHSHPQGLFSPVGRKALGARIITDMYSQTPLIRILRRPWKVSVLTRCPY